MEEAKQHVSPLGIQNNSNMKQCYALWGGLFF